MIINERKTLVDKIKENLIIFSFVLISIIIFFYMFISALMQINEAKKNIKIAKELEEKKLNIIMQSKPPIICNKTYLDSNDYNVISIDNKIVIETLETIGLPEKSIDFSNCKIYDKLTNNMVIPTVTSQEEKLLEEIKSLKVLNNSLQRDNETLKSKILVGDNTIESKNTELKKLIALVESKQTKIDELMQYSIKYKEVKELLSIALSGQSQRLNDALTVILSKETKPQLAVEEAKILDTVKKNVENERVVALQVENTQSGNTLDQIKIRHYVIKQLSKKISKQDLDLESIKIPTIEDLKSIVISREQLSNPENTILSLNKVIYSFVNILNKTNNSNTDMLSENINRVLESNIL